MKYWPAVTNASPYEAVAGSQASSQDRLLAQSYLSNPRRRLTVASPSHHRIRLESHTNPHRILNESVANPHPIDMVVNSRKNRKCAKCPRDTLQNCKVSRGNFTSHELPCKVYPGHFADLQSVPGTLCTYCKVSPGHFAVLQSVPGTLCTFSVVS